MTWVPPAAGRFTSPFGKRVAPTKGATTMHHGVDIAPPVPGQTGRPVVAAHAGVVLASGWSSVRGWWVVIRHDDGSATRSQHLAEQAWVRAGAPVATGQRIGTIGETGTALGEHLHFETFNPGADWTSSANATDPEPFMRARGVELRTAVAVSNPLWTPGGLPTVAAADPLTPLNPRRREMFITRYGSTAYRMVTDLGVVGISETTYTRLKAAGIPAPDALDNTEVSSIATQLAALRAGATVTVDVDEAELGAAIGAHLPTGGLDPTAVGKAMAAALLEAIAKGVQA